MKVVPIVYATNNKYANLLAVSISSIICNSSKNIKYCIYVLHTSLSNENITKIKELSNNNIEIKFVNMKGFIDISGLYERNYITYETYYRFFATKIIKEKKIIYLDCDTIVTRDIVELFDEELNNNVLGMVIDYPNYLSTKKEKYYNAGVLLINSEKFEREKIREKCLQLLKGGNFKYLDQDALNIICKDNIKQIPTKYNYQIDITSQIEFIKFQQKRLKKEFSEKPLIIHYTALTKPTYSIFSSYNNLFWKYAEKTSFFDEMVRMYALNSYNVLKSSPVEIAYINNINDGRIGLKKIINIFLMSIKYWSVNKIKKIKDKENH